ncbi:MAG: small ribosomal subunit Rsm22 family protein [Treponema sp.]|nr:small ribosomal subunit Rsm22 family protein [Treponema sp.]
MERTSNERPGENKGNGLELKWWEKKKGISLEDKKRKLQGKQERKIRRERERLGLAADDDDDADDDVPKKASRKKRRGDRARSFQNDGRRPDRTRTTAYLATDRGCLFARSSLPEDALQAMEDFEKIVSSVYPLTSKQRAVLPAQIRSLSHELTDEREERRMGYMNETTALSAYIHYYLWWNVIRLSRVFANLPQSFFNLTDGSVCLDIGSGPMTVPIALFLARPELRTKKLTFYCMDLSAQALQAGENIFLAVAAYLKCEAWRTVRICSSLGDMKMKEKVDFVFSANLFNELMQVQESDRGQPPDFLAKKYAVEMLKYIEKKNDSARVFISEPGVPSCGRLVSCLRDSFMKRNFYPVAPCSHYGKCPMEGKRGGKWCNFAFSTEDAPESIRRFSRSIYIPKERAVLSFLALEKIWREEGEAGAPARKEASVPGPLSFRISSDPIQLPGSRTGYYACSPLGLLLVVTDTELRSGDLLELELDRLPEHRDEKSGALILNIE